mgnify:CR=1 FL=1
MTEFADTPIDHLWSTDQWTYIRKNIGQWRGPFIQFSSQAAQGSEVPWVRTLAKERLHQHMSLALQLTLHRQPNYTPGHDICCLPTGAFSQGAMVRRPWSSFGAEFSLLTDNRRLRLVQLYNGTASGEHTLDYVTLIPEYRSPAVGPDALDSPPLTLDTVLGTWQGNSLYLPATMDKPHIGSSHWQAQRRGNDLTVTWGQESKPTDPKTQRFTPIDPHRWQAADSSLQFWLLPGGASCTVYPQLSKQQGARLELCWYLSSHQRQRLVRDYGTDGNWIGTSLMLETRQ